MTTFKDARTARFFIIEAEGKSKPKGRMSPDKTNARLFMFLREQIPGNKLDDEEDAPQKQKSKLEHILKILVISIK